MTIGIERTPGGRLWACWVAGGDSPKAFFVLATSDDDGETWSKPRLVVDSHSKDLPRERSVLVGNLWTDPLGRLWLIFDQSMDMFDGRAGVWATLCENPDADEPTWSAPAPHLARRDAEQADRSFDGRVDAADLAGSARRVRAVQGMLRGTGSNARCERVRVHRSGQRAGSGGAGQLSESRLARAHDRRDARTARCGCWHALRKGSCNRFRPTADAPGRRLRNRKAFVSRTRGGSSPRPPAIFSCVRQRPTAS